MFATKFQFDIAKPCTENWEEMTPAAQGRHCSACQKTVVDLTTMTDRQILKAYEKSNGEMCGRALTTQLNQPSIIEPAFVRKVKWRGFAALITGVLGFGHLQGQEAVIPETIVNTEVSATNTIEPSKSIDKKPNYLYKTTFSGVVTDETGESLPFANVILEVDGHQVSGTTTDQNGRYAMEYEGIEEKLSLRTFYVGYQAKLLSGISTKENTVEMNIEMIESNMVMTMGVLISVRRTPSQKLVGLIKRPYYKIRNVIQNSYWDYQETRAEKMVNRIALKKEGQALKEERRQARRQAPVTPEITEIVTIDGLGKQKRKATSQEPSTVYPNPFDEALTVAIASESAATEMQLVLFDVNGREILRQQFTAQQGNNAFELDVAELELPSGSYFLSVLRGVEIVRTVLVEKVR